MIVGSLHRVLKPFILRRVKEDVSLDLPKKVSLQTFSENAPEIIVFVC